MLADEFPEMGVRGPKAVGGTPVMIIIYVEDADAVFDAAVAAGATALRPVEDQFYGDRTGQFEDPFGHRWSVATHVEDVPPDEMEKRAAEAMSGRVGRQASTQKPSAGWPPTTGRLIWLFDGWSVSRVPGSGLIV